MIIAIPAVLLIICVLALPESPRWLASKGRFQDSANVLSTMHTNVEIAKEELHDIKENLKVKQAGWALFKANKNVRRAVFLGVLLQFMQQLTGFNIIMYYSPKILSIAGFSSTEEQMIGTVVNGLVFVLATFIAVGTVDKSGRKPALKRCFAIMAVSLFILGICFLVWKVVLQQAGYLIYLLVWYFWLSLVSVLVQALLYGFYVLKFNHLRAVILYRMFHYDKLVILYFNRCYVLNFT